MDQKEILGLREVVSYYVSNLVGAGILVVPAIAYALADDVVLYVWCLLIVVSWPLARIFATISIRYPHNSGILHFLHLSAPRAIGQFADDITVFVMLVGNPILGFVSARYFLSAINVAGDIYFYLFAFAFMLLSVLFNMLGLRLSAKVQAYLIFLTLAILLSLSGLSLWFQQTQSYTLPKPALTSTGDIWLIIQSIGICFFVFVGWENVAAIAPNVRNRESTFHRAILIAVPLIGISYLFLTYSLTVTVSSSEAADNFAVLDLLTKDFDSRFLPLLVSLFSVLVVIVSCNAWVLAAGKVINGLASEGRFPEIFAKGSEETPHVAFIFLTFIYGIVIFVSYVFGNQEDLIIRFVSAGFILIYLLTLYFFFQKLTSFSARLMSALAIAITLLAASGLYLEVLFLCIAGFGVAKLRKQTKQG